MQRINRLLLKARKQTGGEVFVYFGILDREHDQYKLTVCLWDGVEGSAQGRDDWRPEYVFNTHAEAKAKWEEVQRQYGTRRKYEPVLLITYGKGPGEE